VSYFEGHLMGVYQVVKDLSGHLDEEMFVTALLHDVLEDTEFTYQDIADRFGTAVANNVLWLTKPKDYSYEKYVDRLLEGGSDTAVVVKLADRQFNMVNLMNQGSEEWHRKKTDEAKYILKVVAKRRLTPKYENMKQQLLDEITADVAKMEQ
jgi:(p)ppGpp synthase/HD superfamily hydrolase